MTLEISEYSAIIIIVSTLLKTIYDYHLTSAWYDSDKSKGLETIEVIKGVRPLKRIARIGDRPRFIGKTKWKAIRKRGLSPIVYNSRKGK